MYMVGNRWRHCQCMQRTEGHADDALILGLCWPAQSKQSWVRVPNGRGRGVVDERRRVQQIIGE